MSVICIIPARLASQRFPEKVLAKICGKPMIQHVWERAQKSLIPERVVIACDHDMIFDVCTKFGADVMMTCSAHQSGSDRAAEVATRFPCEIVVNVQADEPLISPKLIDALACALLQDKAVSVATAIAPLDEERERFDPNCVKVVIDQKGNALYFSRAPIPYEKPDAPKTTTFKHLGIYAFRRAALLNYVSLPRGFLEQSEGLEQLRLLEAGVAIKTVLTKDHGMSVDTVDDLKRVERYFSSGANECQFA